MDEYLTIAEVAARLKLSAKTVRNKIAAGVFREGVHFFRPAGLGPRFKWSAVVAWLEQSQRTSGDPKAGFLCNAAMFRAHQRRQFDEPLDKHWTQCL